MSRALLLVVFSLAVAAADDFVKRPSLTLRRVDPTTAIGVPIRISPFAVSPREVTQREYERVTDANPSAEKAPDHPVESVTWWEAIRYCNLRSRREGLDECYTLSTGACDLSKNGYRLLTDAEWSSVADLEPDRSALGPEQTKDSVELAEYARKHTTRSAGSGAANQHGLFDMTGNVWEWVQDWNDPSGAIISALNPQGPRWGTARIVRGGSYLTTSSRWRGELRSSLEPDRRSRYTGFRVCRSLPESPAPEYPEDWFEPFERTPAKLEGELSPIRGGKPELRRKWAAVLGEMNSKKPAPAVRRIAVHEEPSFTGELMYLQVEPDYWEKIYVMLPLVRRGGRLPVVVVPFYDVDTAAGKSMGGRRSTLLGTRSYGHLAVQRGMAAVAIRWFGESYGENAAETVAQLKSRHPQATGMAKWVWDSQRLLDYIETRPEFDASRIAMIGHSLGGKMTLYATAMDDRIRAAVSSEPGIGLKFSNYEDFWYLGKAIAGMEKGTDHHELLAMIAPRPFLLIGGDSADNDKSWLYINAARKVYATHGAPRHIGYFNHRQGHSPTPESIERAFDWLDRFLR